MARGALRKGRTVVCPAAISLTHRSVLFCHFSQEGGGLHLLSFELQRLLKNKGGITVSKSEMEDTAALLERADEELAVLVKIKTPEKKTNIEDMFKSTKKQDVPLEEQVMDEPAVLQQKQEEQGAP